MPGKMDNSWQLYCLFLSCGCGFWLGLLYELCGIGHRTTMHRGGAVLWDVAFCLLAGLSLFLFALPMTGGVLRWYVWVGAAVGFGAFRLTLSRLIRRLISGIAVFLRRLSGLVEQGCDALERIVKKLREKIRKNFKNPLHRLRHRCIIKDDKMG